MKTILIGSTGFIGRAILDRALSQPGISSIVTLSRRDLPDEYAGNPKIKNVVVADFERYDEGVLREIEGAGLCIWSLGGRVPQFTTFEQARQANVTYLHAGAKAMIEHLEPALTPSSASTSTQSAADQSAAGQSSATASAQKFRFVYCSGMFTEHDQNKKLAFLEQSRKLKGEAEVGLIELAKQHPHTFELFIGRPAGVLEAGTGVASWIYGSMGIGKQELAAAMVDIGLNGAENQISDNRELKARGKELLKLSTVE